MNAVISTNSYKINVNLNPESLEDSVGEYHCLFQKNRGTFPVLYNEGAVTLQTTKNDDPTDTYIHASRIISKYGDYILAQVNFVCLN